MLASCKEDTSSLASVIPEHQFWRWKDMWTNSLRNIIFVALLAEYLSTRTLLSLSSAAELIGSESSIRNSSQTRRLMVVDLLVRPESCGRVTLPVEDYLHSVIGVVNELVSLHYIFARMVTLMLCRFDVLVKTGHQFRHLGQL
jgi:hypothetical protein